MSWKAQACTVVFMITGEVPIFAELDSALRERFPKAPPPGSTGWGGLLYRRADFRLRWMATRLHTMAYLVDARSVPPEGIPPLGEDVRRHAKENKGGLPGGFQSGVVAMPIFVVDSVPPQLASWARDPQKVKWAVGLFPIVVTPDRAHVSYRVKPQKWGRLYEKHLRGIAEALVGPVSERTQTTG